MLIPLRGIIRRKDIYSGKHSRMNIKSTAGHGSRRSFSTSFDPRVTKNRVNCLPFFARGDAIQRCFLQLVFLVSKYWRTSQHPRIQVSFENFSPGFLLHLVSRIKRTSGGVNALLDDDSIQIDVKIK